jgi:DNA-binding XRE family transcriptional regulator
MLAAAIAWCKTVWVQIAAYIVHFSACRTKIARKCAFIVLTLSPLSAMIALATHARTDRISCSCRTRALHSSRHSSEKEHKSIMSLATAGAYIKELRKQRRLSQVKLGEAADVSRSTIDRLEKGEPSIGIGTILHTIDILGGRWWRTTPRGERPACLRFSAAHSGAVKPFSARKLCACGARIARIRVRHQRLGCISMVLLRSDPARGPYA